MWQFIGSLVETGIILSPLIYLCFQKDS